MCEPVAVGFGLEEAPDLGDPHPLLGLVLKLGHHLDQGDDLGVALVDQPFDLAAHPHVFAVEHLRVDEAPDIAEIIDALDDVPVEDRVGRGGATSRRTFRNERDGARSDDSRRFCSR